MRGLSTRSTRVKPPLFAGSSAQMRPLLTAAVDVLLELRRHQAPDFLPAYDAGAYRIEVDLLLDWTWPALHDAPASEPVRDEFADLWRDALASIEDTGRHWVLRDLHSPNLLWMPERVGLARVGLIDFQDALSGHLAYDLASLLQDARIDLPADLERDLLAHYCSRAPGLGPRFDEREFRHAYAVLGAQRATKILGGFARLSTLDGKSTYLRPLPRIWRLLEANLGHPVLRPLRAWFDRHFPAALRCRHTWKWLRSRHRRTSARATIRHPSRHSATNATSSSSRSTCN